MLVYFTDTWTILRSFDKFYGHLVYFFRFGVLYQEKSGNPEVVSLLVELPVMKKEDFIPIVVKSFVF
jgi:hypothetical protein